MVNAKRPTGEFVTLPELTDVTRSGFHEGVPWQYQWMVPQDVTGLQEVMGGEDGFVERLDYYFDQPALAANPGVSPSTWAKGGSSYYTTIRYNPGNEPTIMNAWLYGYVGQPWKTNDVLAANLNRFPDTPGGGVGNDDLGTLAAWYVMASLGFEPVMPGSGILALNAPKVQAATVTTDAGATLRIDAAGANEKLPSYVAGLEVDGVAHTAAWLDVAALQDGGTLDFDLSDTSAGLTWGTGAADRIPSVSAVVPPAPVEVEASARCLGAGRRRGPRDQHGRRARRRDPHDAVRRAGGPAGAAGQERLPVVHHAGDVRRGRDGDRHRGRRGRHDVDGRRGLRRAGLRLTGRSPRVRAAHRSRAVVGQHARRRPSPRR